MSRQVVLLDLEYVIYSARNARWSRGFEADFEAELEALAARFKAVNQATGDRLPIPEVQALRMLNVLGRGLLQERALHPRTLSADDVARMLEQAVT